ncbi:hypothetical protein ACIBUY_09640 [Streptomyces sp. NPDC050085]|uniref:hypothetical protein n=1 Tax=Streptomyces sp. NPDC050085 TaxID=3365600 RepID=UPI0037967410
MTRSGVMGRQVVLLGDEFGHGRLPGPRRMVALVPTEDFRQHQLRTLPRAAALHAPVSDPARAQANRIARDRLLADDAVQSARRLGIRVIEVDGTLDAAAVAAAVAEQFAPYLGPSAAAA